MHDDDDEGYGSDEDARSMNTALTKASLQSQTSGQDLGAQRSKNTLRMRTAASKKFSMFLQEQRSLYATFDACPGIYFTPRGVVTNGFQSMGRIVETAKYASKDVTAHKNKFSTTLKFIMEKSKTGHIVR